MAQGQNFRSAFHGFNREDVVRYIEFQNQKHLSAVNQLKSENQALKDELDALRAKTGHEEKDALIAQLQEELAQLKNAEPAAQTDSELEAYRRAERMERAAKERSSQIYRQATAVLSDATAQIDSISDQFCQIADRIGDQIKELQVALDNSRNTLKDAASTMYAIQPEEE